MKADFSQTAAWLKDKLQSQPVAGLILGTGLSSFTDDMEVLATIPYSEVPGFVESTAPRTVATWCWRYSTASPSS